MVSTRAGLTLVAGWLCLIVAGCTATRTEVVVVVDSDIDTPAPLTSIELTVTAPDGRTMQSAGANVDGQALTALFLAAYNHASGLAVTPDKLTPALTVGITQVSLCVAAAGGGGAAPAASTSSGGGGLLWLAAAGLAAKVLLF